MDEAEEEKGSPAAVQEQELIFPREQLEGREVLHKADRLHQDIRSCLAGDLRCLEADGVALLAQAVLLGKAAALPLASAQEGIEDGVLALKALASFILHVCDGWRKCWAHPWDEGRFSSTVGFTGPLG